MTLCARGHSTRLPWPFVSCPDGPEAGFMSLARIGHARTRDFNPWDTCGRTFPEGVCLVSTPVDKKDQNCDETLLSVHAVTAFR